MSDAPDPVTEAALAFLQIARARAAADADPVTMGNARLLCRAAGFDPDMVVMGVPDQAPVKGPKGTIGIYAPMSPAWALYWDDAVAAMEAENARQDSKV